MNDLEAEVHEKYRRITEYLIASGQSVTSMESCTSGLIASLITDTEGASAIMKGAFITYSNEAKIRCGVPESVIQTYGVYSAETAESMAQAAMDTYESDYSIGITGSFGNPDPANPDSVPGIVYIAVKYHGKSVVKRVDMPVMNSRFDYKLEAADAAADILMTLLGQY